MTLELDRTALDHFGRLLSPLSAIGDAESLEALLHRLGWNLQALDTDPADWVQGAQAVDGVLAALQSLIEQDEIEIADLAGVLTEMAFAAKEVAQLVSSLDAAPGVSDAALTHLSEDLVGFLVDQYLASTWPKLSVSLELLGLLKRKTAAALQRGDGRELRSEVERRVFDESALGEALHDPLRYLRATFLLDPQGGRRAALAVADLVGPLLAQALVDAGAAASYGGAPRDGRPALSASEAAAAAHLLVTDFVIAPETAAAPMRVVIGLRDSTSHPGEIVILLGVGGQVTVALPTPTGQLTFDAATPGAPVLISPYGIELAAGGVASFHIGVGFETNPATVPALRFGHPQGLRLEIGGIAARLALDAGPQPDVSGSVDLKQLVLAIQGGDGDGFLAKVLPRDPILLTADLGVDLGLRAGVRFRASGMLEKRFTLDIAFGPVQLQALLVRLDIDAAGLRLHLAATVGLALGPLKAVVEDLGLEAHFRAAAPAGNGAAAGSLGPYDLTVGFKPPSGAGLSVKAGPVTGAGHLFFDPENEQYAGVLELSFKAISVTAIALITTRLPDASGAPGATKQGFSLLVIIAIELPPIQLGYGFTLNGVGGLLGVNRSMQIEPLRSGVRDGSVNSILFPKDVVARAPQIIAQLKAIFPPAEGRYVFGPMVKIGWGPNAILELEAALVLELMSPIRLVVLGRIQAALPDKEDPVLKLRLDIVGVVDFDKGEVSVDASLVDSRLVVFVLTGDMALRIGWGASKQFALAAGGFHPQFQPPPGFPSLRRLAIALADSDNPRLRLETYLALTANTVQVGALLDVYAKAETFVGTFSVSAKMGFDALVQFQPFELRASLGAQVDIERDGESFLHAALFAELTGPTPWHLVGYAEFDFLGRHRIDVDATVGQAAEPPVPRVSAAEVLTRLVEAFEREDAWAALPPAAADRVVGIADGGGAGGVVVHPLGALGARQRVLPLGMVLDRFGSAVLAPTVFSLDGFRIGAGARLAPSSVLESDFAPGQFKSLSDDERVARPAFESMRAGGTVPVPSFRLPADLPGGVTFDGGWRESVVDVEPATGHRARSPVRRRGREAARVKRRMPGALAQTLTSAGAAGDAPTRADGAVRFRGPELPIGVRAERYVASDPDTLAPLPGAAPSSRAEVDDRLVRHRGPAQAALSHEVA